MGITIVATRFNESDSLVRECLCSLASQEGVLVQVLFLDQKSSKKTKQLCNELTTKNVNFTYIEIPARSLSYARNRGIQLAQSDIVAFCDVDCQLDSNWAKEISHVFKAKDVAVVGTKVIPQWPKRPSWYHKSRYLLEFYSMIDLSPQVLEVNKVVGASFAINKKRLGEEGFFDENLGRQKGKLLGGEETDLCARARHVGLRILYTPGTTAHHTVDLTRMRVRWLWRRAFYGGYSRALRGGAVNSFNRDPKRMVDYAGIALILPAYASGLIIGRLHT